jgi:hypothetical protein
LEEFIFWTKNNKSFYFAIKNGFINEQLLKLLVLVYNGDGGVLGGLVVGDWQLIIDG